MLNILEMGRDEILALKPGSITHLLTSTEVFHIAITLNAFWNYDYHASAAGRIGLHAELKSGLHSDGFFISKILLEAENIREIMSDQMLIRIRQKNIRPDYVAGVPDGATSLGKNIAKSLCAQEAHMEKTDGKISLTTDIGSAMILLVEDFCTRGTGFIEAVKQIHSSQPKARIAMYDPVVINRGGLEFIVVSGFGVFKILPIVERRIQDWSPADCPLCKLGSRAIKPKATDENWHLITTSQK